MRDKIESLEGRLRCVVSVPIGGDLWTTVVRVIMRGIAILSGRAHSIVVVAAPAEAFDRVQTFASASTSSCAELADSLGALCDAFGLRVGDLAA